MGWDNTLFQVHDLLSLEQHRLKLFVWVKVICHIQIVPRGNLQILQVHVNSTVCNFTKQKYFKLKLKYHWSQATRLQKYLYQYKPLPLGLRSFHLSSLEPLPLPFSPAFLSVWFIIPSFLLSLSTVLFWSPNCLFLPVQIPKHQLSRDTINQFSSAKNFTSTMRKD